MILVFHKIFGLFVQHPSWSVEGAGLRYRNTLYLRLHLCVLIAMCQDRHFTGLDWTGLGLPPVEARRGREV